MRRGPGFGAAPNPERTAGECGSGSRKDVLARTYFKALISKENFVNNL
jgi:hypothetical protein